MRYEAVIFDLYGTLVDVVSKKKLGDVLDRMASVLNVSPSSFTQLWLETSDTRNKGVFKDIMTNIKFIVHRLGSHPDNRQINRATELRFDYTKQSLEPRKDALNVLSKLKERGYKIGVISDCSPDVPVMWQQTPFVPLVDKAVFSCSVGLKKPDPRIYLLSAGHLGVDPKNCIYVGDGASQELSGAAHIGMYPVKIRVPYEDIADTERPYDDPWKGPTVTSLSELWMLLMVDS